MKDKPYITIAQLAKILGISRIAVYKKVKKGQIEAIKIGKIYAISQKNIVDILEKSLKEADKKQIIAAVKKTVKDYGEVLRLLGRE